MAGDMSWPETADDAGCTSPGNLFCGPLNLQAAAIAIAPFEARETASQTIPHPRLIWVYTYRTSPFVCFQ